VIVWVTGFVSFNLPKTWGSLVLLAISPISCWIAVGALAVAGHGSDTLRGAAEGTTLAMGFGVLVTWRRWMDFSLIRAIAGGFNVTFSRVGRGSYALYLLHYPLLLSASRLQNGSFEGPARWYIFGVLFLGFVVLFCPWLERVSVDLFRPRLSRMLSA
jgi:peptidoglycan/LPS O-acetylase OafA/YrhL